MIGVQHLAAIDIDDQQRLTGGRCNARADAPGDEGGRNADAYDSPTKLH
jgi:hypothetical protein